MAELRVRIRIPNRTARWALAGLCLSLLAAEPGTEKLGVSTYYPAPSGVYGRMTATGNAYLARDGGNVGVGTTSPGARLEVKGPARFGADLAAVNVSATHISANTVSAPGGVVWGTDVRVGGAGGPEVMTGAVCSGSLNCSKADPHTLTISGCSCTAWTNSPSCFTGGCGDGAREQTRTCAPAGCDVVSQCVPDSFCSCGCHPVASGCGQNGCPGSQRAAVYSCNFGGCPQQGQRASGCQFDPTCCTASVTYGACGVGCPATMKLKTTTPSSPACGASTTQCVADASCKPACLADGATCDSDAACCGGACHHTFISFNGRSVTYTYDQTCGSLPRCVIWGCPGTWPAPAHCGSFQPCLVQICQYAGWPGGNVQCQ